MCAAKASPKKFAVIGAGWAGSSAAVELTNAGHTVTLFEAARTLGGRARRVLIDDVVFDNGQHILLGAYEATLRMLTNVGIDIETALRRLPLQMCYPSGSDGMLLIAPNLPAPLHLLGALFSASGLGIADRLALARWSSTARLMGWQLLVDCSVTELLERWGQTKRLITLMWRPLCLAALNTPCERASAQVFLNVLRDSLGARRAASDMLLPCRDLSSLFPTAAAARVALHGSVRPGAQVVALQQQDDARWRIDARGSAVGGNWTAYFDGVVIATGAGAAALLLHTLPGPDNDDIIAQLTAFEHESITTCYLRYAASTRLARPFFALPDDPGRGHWGQFVFDRGQLDPAHAGWLAVVISASRDAAGLDQPELARLIGQQLGRAFGDPGLASPLGYQVISEKRATFACTPALRRPGHATAQTGLVLAGDYTAGDYPATLEGAVRSGIGAAALVSSQ